MAGTTTTELDCLLAKCLVGTNVLPLGVFAADTVPYDKASTARNIAFIVNSDKASSSGQHWVAFLCLRGSRTVEYFDSYGLPLPEYTEICAHMPKYFSNRVHKRNVSCLQSLNSASCGEYCILFLTSRAHGVSFERIVTGLMSRYSTDRSARDRYVVKTVAKLRALVPCVPTRCLSAAADQCCVAPADCTRHSS